MDSISHARSVLSGCSADGNLDIVTTKVETPVSGQAGRRIVSTLCRSARDGQTRSTLVEEYKSDKLLSRTFNQFEPYRSSCRELFDLDGSLISSETERDEQDGRVTKITVRGSGKSSTTRITSGEIEVRATERSVIVETPLAGHSYYPFDGTWISFYKDIDLKLELKSNFLKGPDSVLRGPDGINLVFCGGKLVDLIICNNLVLATHEPGSGIIE